MIYYILFFFLVKSRHREGPAHLLITPQRGCRLLKARDPLFHGAFICPSNGSNFLYRHHSYFIYTLHHLWCHILFVMHFKCIAHSSMGLTLSFLCMCLFITPLTLIPTITLVWFLILPLCLYESFSYFE